MPFISSTAVMVGVSSLLFGVPLGTAICLVGGVVATEIGYSWYTRKTVRDEFRKLEGRVKELEFAVRHDKPLMVLEMLRKQFLRFLHQS